MRKQPHLHDVQDAKATLKRWYSSAKERNKKAAMDETKKMYELMEFLEEYIKNHPIN